MRKIKVRAKKFSGGEWYYGGGVEIFDDPENNRQVGLMISRDAENRPVVHHVDPETVGQFTGIIDKNRKEIWEGDILKDDYRSWLILVEWQKEKAQWLIGGYWKEHVEVIGNIHDHPEILSNKNNVFLISQGTQ